MTPVTPREPVRLAEVEAAAEKAAEGRWWTFGSQVCADVGTIGEFDRCEEANHAASVDPPTVKAIVGALRLAEAALAEVYDVTAKSSDHGPSWEDKSKRAMVAARDALAGLRSLVDFSPAALRQPTYTEPGGPKCPSTD